MRDISRQGTEKKEAQGGTGRDRHKDKEKERAEMGSRSKKVQ